ncbi:MAG: UbiA prenyltransferase family protein [Candidatus Methanofastidiosia archaeon]
MNKIVALLGFYRIHRVVFNLIFSAIIIVILARGKPDLTYLVMGPVLFALGLFSVVGVNNIKDVVADRISKKGDMQSYNPLATDVFTVSQAWAATLTPLGLGIVLAFFINVETFIFFLLFIAFSLFYNLYGKKIVMAPFISPACLALFIVLFGFMMNKESDPVLPYLVLIFYIFMVVGQIGLDILDYEGDKAAGYARLTVVYGPVTGARLAVALSIAMPLLTLLAYIHLDFWWASLPVIGIALLQVVPVAQKYNLYAKDITPLNAKKALSGLLLQYLVIMLAFVVGLLIVGG